MEGAGLNMVCSILLSIEYSTHLKISNFPHFVKLEITCTRHEDFKLGLVCMQHHLFDYVIDSNYFKNETKIKKCVDGHKIGIILESFAY